MNTTEQGAVPTALLASLKNGGEITVTGVQEAFKLDKRQCYNAISRLENQGFLQWTATSTWKVTDAGVKAAKEGFKIGPGSYGPIGNVRRPSNSLRQRAWAAMRVRKYFTIGDIITDAGRGDEQKEYRNLQRYIRLLCKAGIVGERPQRQMGTVSGSNGFKQFILMRDLGPKSPAYRSTQNAMHDFNSGEDLPCTQP